MTSNDYSKYVKMSSAMDNIDFSVWLENELIERQWSQSDLAREAGVHRQVINSYINQKRSKPDEEILRLLADAFGYPPETVFRAAGLLPPKPEKDELVEKITHLLFNMDEPDKSRVLEYVELVNRQSQQRDIVDDFLYRYELLKREEKMDAQKKLMRRLGIIESSSGRGG